MKEYDISISTRIGYLKGFYGVRRELWGDPSRKLSFDRGYLVRMLGLALSLAEMSQYWRFPAGTKSADEFLRKTLKEGHGESWVIDEVAAFLFCLICLLIIVFSIKI
jgi:hypothetical protein